MTNLDRIEPTAGKTYYFLTQTIKPSYYTLRAKDQLKQSWEALRPILKLYTNSYEIVAELTKNHNIHYHGMLEIKSEAIISYLLDHLKVVGMPHSTDFKPVKHYQECKNYMHKNLFYTNKFINKKNKKILPIQFKWERRDVVFIPSLARSDINTSLLDVIYAEGDYDLQAFEEALTDFI